MERNFRIPMSRPDIGEEEKKALFEVLRTNWPSQGKITEEFESLISDYIKSDCIVVNNGSSGLMSALIAHGIKPGDKVVVPDFTFIATSSIPKILGAQILVADIDPETLNVSPENIEKLVKENDVKFVIIVDVAGLPADIEVITELAKRYNFILIEDAAQAFGAEYRNRKLGSFEHLTIFSFQIAKQITTVEGGCVMSTDSNLMKKIRQIKDYGRNKTEMYVHDIVGTNFRTTDLQSAIGIEQLKKVEKHIEIRNKIAREYKNKIKGLNFQKIPDYVTRHSYMIFFTLARDKQEREFLTKLLVEQGIDARKTWLPIHMQPCNPELQKLNCNNAEKTFDKAFTLPIYNEMKLDEAEFIIKSFDKN